MCFNELILVVLELHYLTDAHIIIKREIKIYIYIILPPSTAATTISWSRLWDPTGFKRTISPLLGSTLKVLLSPSTNS